jgi:hypothetical protein
MQAGDAGGLFKEGATVGRLGGDDGADAALAHQGGRMRAGRRIGEQQLHVLGAGIQPIDTISGTLARARSCG